MRTVIFPPLLPRPASAGLFLLRQKNAVMGNSANSFPWRPRPPQSRTPTTPCVNSDVIDFPEHVDQQRAFPFRGFIAVCLTPTGTEFAGQTIWSTHSEGKVTLQSFAVVVCGGDLCAVEYAEAEQIEAGAAGVKFLLLHLSLEPRNNYRNAAWYSLVRPGIIVEG